MRTRIIPILLLQGNKIVKTIRFRNPNYVGDPLNTAKIFCEKQVDEIIIIDIDATKKGQPPNYDLLERLASECFMPITYGGGIHSIEVAQQVISLGIEKVAVNSGALCDLNLITRLSDRLGAQSIVGVIDYKKNLFGKIRVFDHVSKRTISKSLSEWAKELVKAGAGELLINSVDLDGTKKGMDYSLITEIASTISVPLLCAGGAGSIKDLARSAQSGAAGVCAGSLFVYHGSLNAVLINYPNQNILNQYFGEI